MKPEKKQAITEISQALNTILKIDDNNKEAAKQKNAIQKTAKKLYKKVARVAKKKLSKENKLFAMEMKRQLKNAKKSERVIAVAAFLKTVAEPA